MATLTSFAFPLAEVAAGVGAGGAGGAGGDSAALDALMGALHARCLLTVGAARALRPRHRPLLLASAGGCLEGALSPLSRDFFFFRASYLPQVPKWYKYVPKHYGNDQAAYRAKALGYQEGEGDDAYVARTQASPASFDFRFCDSSLSDSLASCCLPFASMAGAARQK